MDKKYIIGLTGNIATGKSLVLRMLRELGAYTIDADDMSHVLMRKGGPLYDSIVTEFGRFILDEDQEIDRGKLGTIVFSAPQAMVRLEAITQPTILLAIEQIIAAIPNDIVVVEAIKLVESGFGEKCDTLWVVDANEDVQLHRLMTRRKMGGAQAMMRIDSQPPQQEKLDQADVVIDNSGDVMLTWKSVQDHFNQIRKKFAPPPEAEGRVLVPGTGPLDQTTIEKLQVRRARRNDLPAIATLLFEATKGRLALTEAEIMERFFSKGYFVAYAEDQLLGCVSLRTENLIAGVDDFLVRTSGMWPTVGGSLLETIEKEAGQLSCEVALLFAYPEAGPLSMSFFEANGYQKQDPEKLIKMWRLAVDDFASEGSLLLVKQMLERRIMAPI